MPKDLRRENEIIDRIALTLDKEFDIDVLMKLVQGDEELEQEVQNIGKLVHRQSDALKIIRRLIEKRKSK